MRSGACNLRPEPTSSNPTWLYPQLGSSNREFREHVNTLLLQQILADPDWAERLTDADRRALSPLFWTHISPYGRFELDMNHRLDFTAALTVPRPRTSPEAETPEPATDGAAGAAS